MPGPTSNHEHESDVVIWSGSLVLTMLDLLDGFSDKEARDHGWDVAPSQREPLCETLLALLERQRYGWIIADVPSVLVHETRTLRIEAQRRLREG